MTKETISVIIPCYNDGETITLIINELKKSDLISEIIVVDDHSKTETIKVLEKIQGIKLIKQDINHGKTYTLSVGFNHSSSSIIAFIDSDLVNFKCYDFEKMIEPVLSGKCDITLSLRGKEALHGRLSGYAFAFTGERVIKKNLLAENIDIFDNHDYIFEAAFNKRFFGNYRVRGVYLENVGQKAQFQKQGYIGLLADIKQTWSLVKFLGIREFIRQLLFVKQPNFKL